MNPQNLSKREDAIVSPVKSKKFPDLGPVSLMAATYPDLYTICDILKADISEKKKFDISGIYFGREEFAKISVTGPFVGAPYAVMLLERLILYGVKKIIFIGWCGSISPDIRIGDIILPESAFIDEGTSPSYGAKEEKSFPDSDIVESLEDILIENGKHFYKKSIWSTDAIYRETIEKVEYYRKKGASAVEMEASALFSAGKFKNIRVGSLLTVSDELFTFKWKSGFSDKLFVSARKKACETACHLAYNLTNQSLCKESS